MAMKIRPLISAMTSLDSLVLKKHLYKNSSGDETANMDFYAVRPEATRIRQNNAK